MTLGSLVFDAAASVSRALPHFRGKWQAADLIRRRLLPLRGTADPLCFVRMQDGSRMTWDLRDDDEGRAVWLGRWDDDLRDAIISRLSAGAVALDVGASVGAWTVPLARRLGAGARVHAFEPVPSNLMRLTQAVADNALSNVSIWEIALGDASARVDMWLRASVTGAVSGTAAVVRRGTGQVTVTMRPLDEWAAEAGLERLDFIKLDVEGSELMVLAGAEQAVTRFRPLILAELDDYWLSTHDQAKADATQWAVARDYRLMRWDRSAGRFVPTVRPEGDATLLVPAERT